MEQTPIPEPTKGHPRNLKGLFAVGVLGLSTLACRASDLFASPDPFFSFLRGSAGMLAIELEFNMGKLIKDAKDNMAAKIAATVALTIPSLAVGALSVEYPEIGYLALAIPVIAGFVHVTRR